MAMHDAIDAQRHDTDIAVNAGVKLADELTQAKDLVRRMARYMEQGVFVMDYAGDRPHCEACHGNNGTHNPQCVLKPLLAEAEAMTHTSSETMTSAAVTLPEECKWVDTPTGRAWVDSGGVIHNEIPDNTTGWFESIEDGSLIIIQTEDTDGTI